MPRLLLDTHVLVWFINHDPKLGSLSRSLIEQGLVADRLCLSSVTFWEVALLSSKGRVALNTPPTAWRTAVLGMGVREYPLDGDVAIRSALLADLHRDPADRFIMATAIRHGATLVTADNDILAWAGPLPRLDARS